MKSWYPNTWYCKCGCGAVISDVLSHKPRMFASVQCRWKFYNEKKRLRKMALKITKVPERWWYLIQ